MLSVFRNKNKVNEKILKLVEETKGRQGFNSSFGKARLLLTSSDTNELISGVSYKMLMAIEDTPYIAKLDNVKDAYNEYVSYALGRALGYNINEVILVSFGEDMGLKQSIFSLTKWEYDFVTANKSKKFIDKNIRKHSRDKNDLNFFDFLIDNEDRHTSNWGYLNEELFLIDNGCSYPSDTNIVNSNYNSLDVVICCDQKYINNFMNLSEVEIIDICTPPNMSELKEGDNWEYMEIDRLINRSAERFMKLQRVISDVLQTLKENEELAV